jgi:two-component sensor histidine kinase
VSWQIEEHAEGGRLSLTWAEHDGPPVKPPAKEGFGTNFLQRSVDYELNGAIGLAFEPDGLRCRIEVPLRDNADQRLAAGVTSDGS